MAEIGIHDLTSPTSHSPFVVAGSNDYFANPAYMAFDSAAGNSFHINQGGGSGQLVLRRGNAGGTEITPHDLTSSTSHSPIVVTDSSEFSGSPAWHCFDGNLNSVWTGTGGGTDWIEVDFGSGNTYTVRSYWILFGGVAVSGRAPKNWTFEGSNDGSSWTAVHTVTNQTDWEDQETRYFEPTDTSTAYRYFRLNISANNGDSTYTQIAEVYIYTTALDTTRRKSLGSYQIQVATNASRCPNTWKVQGNNHLGGGWVDVDTVSGETSWGSNETRTYTSDDPTTVYESYRFNFTSNNGDGTYTEIQEWTLTEGGGGTVGVDKTASDSISLSDSITQLLLGVTEKTASDSLSLSDSISQNLAGITEVEVGDVLVLTDIFSYGVDLALQISDTIALSDSIPSLIATVLHLADSLSLSDSIILNGAIDKILSDRLTLSDLISFSAPSTNVIGDSLGLSDSVKLVTGINLSFSDSVILTDSATDVNTVILVLVVGDTFTFMDSVGTLMSTRDTNYIRNYLNDVQGVRDPESISDPTPEDPGALNSYLRRYLNDVSN